MKRTTLAHLWVAWVENLTDLSPLSCHVTAGTDSDTALIVAKSWPAQK